ncbi:hypothetical protein C7E19_24725, partial [Stenotrophomonas maltophilia]
MPRGSCRPWHWATRAACPTTTGEHLRALGLTHLVAISGFHVGVVAGFGVLLCR